MYYFLAAFFTNLLLCTLVGAQARKTPKHLNVLFLSADDLRTDLSIYEHPTAKTPNLDRSVGEGVRI